MKMKQIAAAIIALTMALVSPAGSYTTAKSDPVDTGNITEFLDSFLRAKRQ